MSSEWPTVKLGDYCKKIGSGATPRGGANVYTSEGAICLIRSQNIYNEGFRPSGLVYIDVESADKLKNVTVEENDVLLNITGDSVARVCLAKKTFLPARVNQHVAIIRPHEKEFDPRFIRYLLASPAYQGILLSIAAVGATRNAITKGMIENLDVIKPPIKQQVKIADKLEALDDKIELNTQINQTLEQIAQALFKSWFVDFDPVKAKIAVLEAGGTAEAAELAAMGTIAAKSPEQLADMQQSQPEAYQQLTQTAALFPAAMQNSELGQIPKGWKVDALGSINYAKGGYAFKSKDFSETGNPVIKIKNILSTGEIDTKACQCINNEKVKIASQFKLNNGDLLIAMTGATVGKSGIYVSDGRNAYLNQRVARLQSKIEKKYNCWFTYHLINLTSTFNQIISTAQGSAQANISSKDIELAPAMIPSHELIKLFNKYTSPMYRNWIANLQHKLLLAGFRDTLLPKLLSGAIDLAHINKSSPSNL